MASACSPRCHLSAGSSSRLPLPDLADNASGSRGRVRGFDGELSGCTRAFLPFGASLASDFSGVRFLLEKSPQIRQLAHLTSKTCTSLSTFDTSGPSHGYVRQQRRGSHDQAVRGLPEGHPADDLQAGSSQEDSSFQGWRVVATLQARNQSMGSAAVRRRVARAAGNSRRVRWPK